MDEAQNEFFRSGKAMVYEGQVTDRKVYTFNTYEQASKEREKYIISP